MHLLFAAAGLALLALLAGDDDDAIEGKKTKLAPPKAAPVEKPPAPPKAEPDPEDNL